MYLKHFEKLIEMQKNRVEQMKSQGNFISYDDLDEIIIGVCGGDGIGPAITAQAQRVLEHILSDKIEEGKVSFRTINNLTIEHRAEVGKAIPDDVLEELKKCHVILKGPTTTPKQGDPWPNIESANVAMRKELDLFANVRPVKVPAENIDWVFFRENTEGAYAVGSLGLDIDQDIAVDYLHDPSGTERIIRLAFEHARKTGRTRVTAVTKANVIKTTDGMFLILLPNCKVSVSGG